MTMSAPTTTAPPKPPQQYKRSFRNYLIDSRFQLKYTGMILGVAIVISTFLGVFLWQTSGEVVQESQKVVEQSKKVSDVVQMSINDDPVYGGNPDLAQSFHSAAAEQDNKILAQQATLVRQQHAMLYELVGGLAVMVFLLGVLGILITHRVAGPIYKMKLLLRQVTDGKLKVGARLRKGDELQEFFDVFAQMVESLRDRQAREVEELDRAIETAKAAGMSAASVDKFSSVRDEMKRALDV
jgi:nitrogen fixation/metabolism regulation signal transduction histidine kinase